METSSNRPTSFSFEEIQLHLEYFNGFLSPESTTTKKDEDGPIDTSLITPLGQEKIESINQLFLKLFDQIEDCRYLAAYETFQKIKEEFQYPLTSPDTSITTLEHDEHFLNLPLLQQYQNYQKYDKNKLIQFIERVKDIQDTIAYQDDSVDSGWTLGADLFGVKTYYRVDEKDGSLIMKLIGSKSELPIFELCAVLKEVDLFYEWVPFCKESAMVDRVGKAEVIPYVWLSSPFLGRDFAFQAYAADLMFEHGQIIVLGKSVGDYTPKPVPFKKAGWMQDKMIMKELKSIINIRGPMSAQNTMILHVDMNSSLPQSILNWTMKNISGMLLYLFGRQAMKASQDPNCSHAKRIREDVEFYRDWLLPKIRAYCDYKGWEQPTITSLGPDGIPPAISTKAQPASTPVQTPSTSDKKNPVRRRRFFSFSRPKKTHTK